MKKIIYSIATLGILFFSSCADETFERGGALQNGNEITFTIADDWVTRATPIESQQALSNAYGSMKIVALNGNTEVFSDYVSFTDDGKNPSGNYKTVNGTYYWPTTGDTYDFFVEPVLEKGTITPAATPYNSGSYTFTYTIPEVGSNDAIDSPDLVFAHTRQNSGAVALDFKHALASVRFVYENAQMYHRISEISVDGAYSSGQCTFTSANANNMFSWTKTGTSVTLTQKFEGNELVQIEQKKDVQDINVPAATFMLIPGCTNSGTDDIIFNVKVDGHDCSLPVKASSLHAGQMITVKIKDDLSLERVEGIGALKYYSSDYRTLTLETWLEGESSATPADIVLVVDVSGSMKDPFNSESYDKVNNTGYSYDSYGTQEYYYKSDDNKYYKVSRENVVNYTAVPSAAYTYDSYGTSELYYNVNGTYYLVSRGLASYRSLGSKTLSVNNYGNGSWYVEDNGSYYVIQRQRNGGTNNNPKYDLFYKVGGTTKYILYNTRNTTVQKEVFEKLPNSLYTLSYTTNNQTYYLSGTNSSTTVNGATNASSTIWTGVLYQKSTDYYLTFTSSDNKKHYLSGTGISDTKVGETTSGATIWTGELYQHNTTSSTRMAETKAALTSFINEVKTKAAADHVDHQVALVKFAGDNRTVVGNDRYSTNNRYNYSQIVTNLSNNYDTVNSKVSELSEGGATAADRGMAHAKTILDGRSADRKQKAKAVIVMITDGEPNHGSGFDGKVANDAIDASKELKTATNPVEVWSVYIGGDLHIGESNQTNDQRNIENYMNGVSSNYPNATAYTSLGARVDDKYNYFINANNSSELNKVFASVTAGLDKLGSGTVIKDVLSSAFNLPSGISKDQITIKAVKFASKSTDGNITWGEELPSTDPALSGVTVNETELANNTLVIEGFDFKKYFCGTHIASDASSYGCKLVITISGLSPIQSSESIPAGTYFTNGYGSGICDSNGNVIAPFTKPDGSGEYTIPIGTGN